MAEEEKPKESRKAVYDPWLTNIYNSLLELEYHEKLARTGCADLIQFSMDLSQHKQDYENYVCLVKQKNLEFWFTKFDLLVGNLISYLEKKIFDELKKKADNDYSLVSGASILKSEGQTNGLLLNILYDQRTGRKRFFLNEKPYNYLVTSMRFLREKLVKNIGQLLFAFDEHKQNKQTNKQI